MKWDEPVSYESVFDGIKGVVFDFDGTLMDSMPDWAGKMLHLLDTYGVVYPADIIRTITPLGDGGAARYFQEKLGLTLSEAEIRRELDAYALPKYRDSILPKTGVYTLLQRLAAERIPTCILTASPQHMIRPCLERCDMTNFFRFAWCCDDLGLKKTQPEIYAKTCEELGTKAEQTLFFDDNLLAITAGASAGLVTAAVFDPSSAADEPELRQTADWYIRSFVQLQ